MYFTLTSKHKIKDAIEQAGGYPIAGEPVGIDRVNSGDNLQSGYHGFPRASIFANILEWQFKSAYDVDATNVWDMANTGSGTVLTPQDGRGGWAKVVNHDTNNDYYSYQSKYKPIALASGKSIWIVTEIKVKVVGQADIFVGLTPAVATTSIFDARVDSVGFYLADEGAGLLYAETSKASSATQTSTGVTMVDATSIKLGIKIDGLTHAYFYVNDVYKVVHITNLPTVDMGFAFAIRNGEGAANEFSINTIFVGMDR
jgi:hypothetical protein